MELTTEKIAELKKTHGNELYKACISYRDKEGKEVAIEFVHKKPDFSHFEMCQKDMAKMGVAVANQNLIISLAVFPAGAELRSNLEKAPVAVDKWLGEHINPHFGGDVLKTSSEAL